jgi:hypothetical protein
VKLFRPPTPPNTISDERWHRIQRGANKAEAREGGMWSQQATARRRRYLANYAKKTQN